MLKYTFKVEADHTVLDYFYDLEFLLVLTKDADGNRFLRGYETILNDPLLILDVRRPQS